MIAVVSVVFDSIRFYDRLEGLYDVWWLLLPLEMTGVVHVMYVHFFVVDYFFDP